MNHPMQTLIDTIGETAKTTRSDYHLTLSELIDALNNSPDDAVVEYTDGGAPGGEMSYRGYYSDLAFQDRSGEDNLIVSEFREQCRKALNASYTGYKGGEFIMGAKTPLWRSEYSTASGSAIMDTLAIDGKFLLTCKQVED